MALTEEQQAVLFASRERTAMWRGRQLDIPRTHKIVGASTMESAIPVGSFGSRNSIVTFKTRIRSTASSGHAGNIFSYGDATGAVAAWVDGQTINFRAGDATVGTDASIIQLDLGANPSIGWEATLVVMVRPDGLVGMWAPDFNVKLWSAGVDLGSFSVWTNDVAGNYSQAGGAMPADVTETGNPTSFDLIEPLSVYYGSFPRINIGANQI